jgi:hypothetical protein
MLKSSLFSLKPFSSEKVIHISFIIDQSFAIKGEVREELLAVLNDLNQYIFDKEYNIYAVSHFFYFDGIEVKKLSSNKQKSLKPLLESQGLPMVGKALFSLKEDLLERHRQNPNLTHRVFLLLGGHSSDSIESSIESIKSIKSETLKFFMLSFGFFNNQTPTIRLDGIKSITSRGAIIPIKPGSVTNILNFIYESVKKSIESDPQIKSKFNHSDISDFVVLKTI